MFSLKDKIVLVTGASGGIGSEICRVLSKAGAKIALSGTRVERLQEVQKDLVGESEIFPCNLSDSEAVSGLIGQVVDKFGSIDVLVNNAGLTADTLAMRLKDEDWDKVIAVNLTSTFKLCRAALKPMMKSRFGRIINMTSIVGHTGNPGQINYVASKAGMTGLAKSLAQEVATRGITVNCVAPGFIASEMTEKLNDAQKEGIMTKIPMQKMGEAKDIANAVLYLASDEASYITGQTIHVNGGMAML